MGSPFFLPCGQMQEVALESRRNLRIIAGKIELVIALEAYDIEVRAPDAPLIVDNLVFLVEIFVDPVPADAAEYVAKRK